MKLDVFIFSHIYVYFFFAQVRGEKGGLNKKVEGIDVRLKKVETEITMLAGNN